MGAVISRRMPDYEVVVKTGDVKGAGTDANVYICLIDEDGRRSRDILLDVSWRDDFEKGSTDVFKCKNVPSLGRVHKVELWRDSKGLNDDWFLEWVKVKATSQSSKKRSTLPEGSSSNLKDVGANRAPKNQDKEVHPEYLVFPCNRWIKEKKRFVITKYDAVLPQFDEHKEQRAEELEEKKKKYCFTQKAPGMPKQVKECPPEESFSNDYKWDLTQRKFKLLALAKITKMTSDSWTKLEDIRNVFKGPFGIPYGFFNWKSDEHFGRQRLRGVNATLIVRCTELPTNLAVTSEMVEPFLEGKTLQDAIADKEIYMTNLHDLDGVPCSQERTLCSPIALFHAKRDGELMPICIQLFQEPSDDNPVFLPSDPKYTWMLAKMYYNNADAAMHQACTHLGFTHLICESIAVSVHRELSPSHPIFRFVMPHFLYLIAINSLALERLVSPGGWVDLTMTMGRCGMFEIVRRKWASWRMSVEGWLPESLKARGVDDENALPSYPYRDDALLIHEAIHKYVSEMVNLIYDTPQKLVRDHEIQNWAKCLVDAEEGCGIQGVPGDGKFETNDQLIRALTAILFLSSVGHAAANFNQYDEYAFPPNYPAILRGKIPRTKIELQEQDIIDQLPQKDTTLSIMVVTKILSDRGTNALGDFEVQYMYDPNCLKIVEKAEQRQSIVRLESRGPSQRHAVSEKQAAARERYRGNLCAEELNFRFREDLKRISLIIKERNRSRQIPYPYLDPEEVPNAISI